MNQKVSELLMCLNADRLYRSSVRPYIRDNFQDIYQKIITNSILLDNALFPEMIFCYVNNIQKRPICKKCDNEVAFRHGEYKTYCSGRCSIKDIAMHLGVDNVSQSDKVKEKKRQTCLKNYGVDNASKSTEIKEKLSNKKREYWNNLLAGQRNNDLTKCDYYKEVIRYTEWAYKTYQGNLDPDKLRSRQFHIDHKVSICAGYQNNIPPYIIGDICNLELLNEKENTSKQHKCSMTISELFEKYENFHSHISTG